MKRMLISLLCLLVGNRLYSQIDSTAKSFFPTSIGNSWHYQYTQTQGYITTLTRDSIANRSQFLFFDSSNVPAYEIDSMLNIISGPTTGNRILQYKLAATKGEVWISRVMGGGNLRITARVDDVFWSYVLGTLTQVKRIGYYYQPYPDTTSFASWRNDDYIAAGFGFYLQITDAMQTPAEELYGCIISGKTYGIMTSVRDAVKGLTPLSYRLYPAFPNLFNPISTIKYQLSKDGLVTLKVYDILGREVAELVNEKKQAGFYQIVFNASMLASGIYIYRISVNGFVLAKKMLLIK